MEGKGCQKQTCCGINQIAHVNACVCVGAQRNRFSRERSGLRGMFSPELRLLSGETTNIRVLLRLLSGYVKKRIGFIAFAIRITNKNIDVIAFEIGQMHWFDCVCHPDT